MQRSSCQQETNQTTNTMKNFKITIKSATSAISYDVVKTLKGANGFAKKIANDAFYGEQVEILITELK